MSSMIILILISLSIGLAAWFLFLWAVKSGQFDDVERPKYRMLDDDDDRDKNQDKDKDKNKEKNTKSNA
ncbi:MAG: cbb3-type cytochrome oxidase assembly protein CcoS [Syntrophobacteraceae bacterium]